MRISETSENIRGVIRPCIGCGYCCKTAMCSFGMAKGINDGLLSSSPSYRYGEECPYLYEEAGRYWCKVAEKYPREIGVGTGCSSTMFNTVREGMLRKEKE